MSVIQVDHLTKTYISWKKQPGFLGSLKSLFKREKIQVEAVKKISFDINEGELIGFIGPNGAGKTTTLKMLSGILWPTSGKATVLGFTPWERKHAYLKQISLVMGQKAQLWWDLPARDSFELNKAIYDIPEKHFSETFNELVELLDVKNLLDIQVRRLSLGERMKMELIAALLHRPKVLFLDEPTIGLDVVSQQKMREFIREWNRRHKTTILLTSHYMADVEALATRLIIINHGSLLYDGSLHEFMDQYVQHKVISVTFSKDVSRGDVESYGKIREWKSLHAVIEVPKDDVAKNAAAILTKLPVEDILIDEVELEEIIRKIFTR